MDRLRKYQSGNVTWTPNYNDTQEDFTKYGLTQNYTIGNFSGLKQPGNFKIFTPILKPLQLGTLPTPSLKDPRKAPFTTSLGADGIGGGRGNTSRISPGLQTNLSAGAGMLGGVGAMLNKKADSTALQGREQIRGAISTMGPIGAAIGAGTAIIDLIGDVTGLGLDSLDKVSASRAGLKGAATANNIITALPGLGTVAGVFGSDTKKGFKSHVIDDYRGAYSGTARDIDASVELGGKRVLFGKGRANRFIGAQNRKNQLVTDIGLRNNLRKSSTYGDELTSQNRNLYSGINAGSNMIIGKLGMKMQRLEEARELLKKAPLDYERWKEKYNLKESKDYDLKAAYELGYVPNKSGHLPIINEQTGEFLAAKDHPAIQSELDWFNSEASDAVDFKNTHILATAPNGKYQYINKFAEGGKMNVIAQGALHSRKHRLEEVNDNLSEVTQKGIPVISLDEGGELIQHAEIEGGELILTKELTSKLEELYATGTDEAMVEAGKLLAEEIIENTEDNTNEILDDEDND